MTARVASEVDVPLVVDICVGGFTDDPVMSWVFPDRDERVRGLKIAFTGLTRGYLVPESVVHVVDDGCATLWRTAAYVAPPPADDDGESPFSAEVQERFRILTEGMAAAHPHDPHWYLNVIATHPSRQGQGLGAKALAPVLALADAAHEAAYLESSNPRNMTLYRRHGFEEIGDPIELPDGPALYPMWREAR